MIEPERDRELRDAQFMLFSRLVAGSPGKCWFTTVTFPSEVSETKAREKVDEWLRRLRQRLFPATVEDWQVYSLQPLRQIWHCHLVVKSENLDNLDKETWKGKWQEITGRRVVASVTKRVSDYRRMPAVIRRRNGVDTVVSNVINFTITTNDVDFVYRNCGTAEITDAGTPNGVLGYIFSHHSCDEVCW